MSSVIRSFLGFLLKVKPKVSFKIFTYTAHTHMNRNLLKQRSITDKIFILHKLRCSVFRISQP